MDLDKWITKVKEGQHLLEDELQLLCEYVKEILIEESNVQPVNSPVTVCGDIHGQFHDLMKLFQTGGHVPETNYIFMGDFVDLGYNSLEVFTILLLLKARYSSSHAFIHCSCHVDIPSIMQLEVLYKLSPGQAISSWYNIHISILLFSKSFVRACRYPANITLLRGNHESRQLTQLLVSPMRVKLRMALLFWLDEWSMTKNCPCLRDHLILYTVSMMSARGSMEMPMAGGTVLIFRLSDTLSDYRWHCKFNSHTTAHFLPFEYCSQISVLCVHGGLSPDIRTIDQIRVIERNCEIPHEGPFCDLMWSDPEDIETWAVSPRGAGWLFGSRVTSEFNHINNLDLVCRAHQLVQEGLKYMFQDKGLVTVWSAPNYCYRCGNVASILSFNENMVSIRDFYTAHVLCGIKGGMLIIYTALILLYCLSMRMQLWLPALLFEREVKFFTETEENNHMRGPRTGVPYFL
ncbi:hypothetical protein SADUNF_Sadunf10G0198100 [Salix dunnii]|uniref:Serine/threonine-protein phosphatase n=1 Tax=Salix dunnii TaxID=1413687 RepID=A0A835JRG3_9ROSI|nr:hypothetical protein SADUNF_Sadunf10G0198100 [Salix dunnii]